MKKQQIVVNTIAFMEQVRQGAKQLDFFESLAGLGITQVEVRQEYFSENSEFAETARAAERSGLTVLYSVPQTLFREGRLDRDVVRQSLREAEDLSAVAVKWTRGAFAGWSEADRDWMIAEAKAFQGLLTVENDQTMQDGTIGRFSEFLLASEAAGVPLYATFDIGNWSFVGEDALANARLLAPWVRYIHVKDVAASKDAARLQAVPLGVGDLPLCEIFHLLPTTVPVALEYPCGSIPLDVLRQGVEWLAQVNGVHAG